MCIRDRYSPGRVPYPGSDQVFENDYPLGYQHQYDLGSTDMTTEQLNEMLRQQFGHVFLPSRVGDNSQLNPFVVVLRKISMQVKVDTDALTAMAQALSSAADALSGEMDDLATASRTMRSGWKGEAQAAWTGRHAQIDSTLRHKAAILQIASRRVSQYAHEIAEADAQGARLVLGL